MNQLKQITAACIIAVFATTFAPLAYADAVTEWNTIAGDMIVQSRMGTPPAVRVMAIAQTAVHDAVVSVQRLQGSHDVGISTDAAIAAANRTSLLKLLPSPQHAAIEAAYKTALAKLPDGAAKTDGIAVGEQAAMRVLAWRADDGASTPETYRPHAAPGHYVPTAAVAAPQWPQRKPWLMDSASQFRPAPPPALTSAVWARDYNEVKSLGSKNSNLRTPEQTEAAKFWEYSLPPIYYGVIRSVADAPGRTVVQNARLLAATSQAMDDAVIAVLDAKYHHGFWRPVTAIRNGDLDQNAATERDAGWAPLIDNPIHPEYPSAHSILASAVGELLKAEVGAARMPELSTTSPTANGAKRRWKSANAFMQEVADSRVWEGIHFRFSTETGLAMGKRIAALAAVNVALPPATATVPKALTPKVGRFIETIAARGTQNYECRADGAAPTGPQWVFIGPQAELYDRTGRVVGTHYAGPHWEAADGSKIVGALEAKLEAPQADAVAWLLLSAKSAGGQGRFAQVTNVLRVNTIGGLAPSKPCSAAVIGQTERVPYRADYLLYSA